MATVDVDGSSQRQTPAQVDWLGLRIGDHLTLYVLCKLSSLSHRPCHDDNLLTLSIVFIIFII